MNDTSISFALSLSSCSMMNLDILGDRLKLPDLVELVLFFFFSHSELLAKDGLYAALWLEQQREKETNDGEEEECSSSHDK